MGFLFSPKKAISTEFYQSEDVIALGQDLLGKALVTSFDGVITAGIIIETESYKGPEDRASHAYNMRRTKRNEVMYAKGGHAYVYLCYGIHPLLNVVTNFEGIPHAVLIRAIKPIYGFETMQQRDSRLKAGPIIGPGKVTKALGITMKQNGHLLQEAPLWIEDIGIRYRNEEIERLHRVGIDYAGPDATLPWRFRVGS